jgi:glutamate--cysteine ligase
MDDFDDHLSTIFPEVRLKTFLEMRGADAGPQSRLCALSAFWVGLLYDETSLDDAWQLVKDWTTAEREGLRRSVPAMGLQAPFRTTNAHAIAKQALAMSRAGLKRRSKLNDSGDDETVFLSEIDDIAETGVNSAQRLLEKYHGEWRGDVRPVFEESRF